MVPSKEIMPEYKILTPNPELNKAAIEQGKSDAQKSLDMGYGESFKTYLADIDPWFGVPIP